MRWCGLFSYALLCPSHIHLIYCISTFFCRSILLFVWYAHSCDYHSLLCSSPDGACGPPVRHKYELNDENPTASVGDIVSIEVDLRSSDPSQRFLFWYIGNQQLPYFITGVPSTVKLGVCSAPSSLCSLPNLFPFRLSSINQQTQLNLFLFRNLHNLQQKICPPSLLHGILPHTLWIYQTFHPSHPRQMQFSNCFFLSKQPTWLMTWIYISFLQLHSALTNSFTSSVV